MGCGSSKASAAGPAPAAPDVLAALAATPGLEDAASWMTAEQARLARVLLDAGQEHCFAKWTPGSVEKKAAFFTQVRAPPSRRHAGACKTAGTRGAGTRRRAAWRRVCRAHQPPPAPLPPHTHTNIAVQVKALEGGYPGGVAAYVKNAKQLLVDSAKGVNPFEGLKPEVRPASA